MDLKKQPNRLHKSPKIKLDGQIMTKLWPKESGLILMVQGSFLPLQAQTNTCILHTKILKNEMINGLCRLGGSLQTEQVSGSKSVHKNQ